MTIRRRLATQICQTLPHILPKRLGNWAFAIGEEVSQIPDDTDALFFAFSGFIGLIPHAFSGETRLMKLTSDHAPRPRIFGIGCLNASVLLGIAYMAMAGAPMRNLGMNAAALLIAVLALATIAPIQRRWSLSNGLATTGLAILLLSTALFGNRVEGAARWFSVGPVVVQISLIALPVMIMGFSKSRDTTSTAALIIAAIALAIQPDRAMAGMLAATSVMIAFNKLDRNSISAALISLVAFGITLARADTLPAMPYVDQILYSAFGVHPLAGLAVLGGSALLLAPAVYGWRHDPENRVTYAVFGAVWLSAILAAALGNYPTPIVGYGGSAIIGYALSLVALPKSANRNAVVISDVEAKIEKQPHIADTQLRLA